jgi:hypothetical protein
LSNPRGNRQVGRAARFLMASSSSG